MMLSQSELSETHAIKCELAADVLRSYGTLRLQVTGWSMLPVIRPGDVLEIHSAASEDVSKGDIVLFSRDRRLFAHRVVSTNFADSGILTRGDAMSAPDPTVGENQLLGRVSLIVRDGKSITPSRTPRRSERAIAALVRSSNIAAGIVVGVHGLQRVSQV